MVLQGVVFVTDLLIVLISSLGTLSHGRPRRHLPFFLYTRCLLFLPEAILASYGVYYISQSDILRLPHCPALIKAVCLFGVLSSITVFTITIIIVWVIFDPWGASQQMRNYHRVSDARIHSHDQVQLRFRLRAESNNVWETRLRTLCCCFLSNTDVNRNALKDVAQLFSETFEVEMDIVPSDVSKEYQLLRNSRRNSIEPRR